MPIRTEPGRIETPRKGTPLLPLTRVLAVVRNQADGEVIEVELEEDEGRRVYEVSLLTPEGWKIEITVDAQSGQVLERE